MKVSKYQAAEAAVEIAKRMARQSVYGQPEFGMPDVESVLQEWGLLDQAFEEVKKEGE